MKTSFVIAAVALVLTPLSQAAWVSVSDTADAQVYFDDAIAKEGDRVTVWRLTNFTQPLTNLEGKEISSEKSRTTVDCAGRKMANSQVMRFAGKDASGDVLNSYETPLRFTTVASGSTDADLLKKLCAP
ncbi:MAG: hypothetical protein EBR42_03780 [Betaproteobacteria bacterium]|nr:hypothetical protein [Betaproteobacteria bacterium]